MKRFHFYIVFFLVFGSTPYIGQSFFLQKTKKEKIIPKKNTKYKVIKVKDGDTIVILVDNRELGIRLNHIDCPEKKQPFGTKAKQFVSDACFGEKISLVHHNKYDRYGRLIAEVILPNGKNLNKELVRNGLAWHFIKYSTDMEYAQLELSARKKKINIWTEKNPIAPWNWRKSKNNPIK